MDAVRAHLDHHEKIPGTRFEQMFGHGKSLRGHLINLAEQPLLLVRAKALHIDHIVANQALQFGTQLSRIGVLALRTGSQKTADQGSAQRLYRISWRHADDDGIFSFPAEDVPDSLLVNAGRVRHREFVIAILAAVAEAVDSQLAGIAAGHHAHPSRYRDGRSNAAKFSVYACAQDPLYIRKIVQPRSENQLRIGTIQTDHH